MIVINNRVNGANSSCKVYLALLNQVGTANPVVTILNGSDKNFLGELVWTRDGVGLFGTSSDLFLNKKTIVNGFNPFTDGLNPESGLIFSPELIKVSAGPLDFKSSIVSTKSTTKKISFETANSLGVRADGLLSIYSLLIEIVVFD